MDLRGWVNDGLITVFFLTVGLELKRELVVGELRDLRTAALPIIAAGGGMVGSALVYVAFTAGTPSVHGWGIPMATDLALALGVLSLLGNRVSSSVKLFVLALAVADDLGSIVVLAIFYQHDFSWIRSSSPLPWSVSPPGCARSRSAWMPLTSRSDSAMWIALYEAGISPTLAGVGWGSSPRPDPPFIDELEARTASSPMSPLRERSFGRSGLPRRHAHRGTSELVLHPWSSFVAFQSSRSQRGHLAQRRDARPRWSYEGHRGRALRKARRKVRRRVGRNTLAQRLGIGRLPEGMGPREVLGIGALLASASPSRSSSPIRVRRPNPPNQTKLAVLVAAVISAAVAVAILRRRPPVHHPLGDAARPRFPK